MASDREAKITFKAETEEFQKAIKDANNEMRDLRADMKLNEAEFQNTGDATEYLTNKTELLEAQLDANRQKQEALTNEIEVAKNVYGENSEEVSKLERQLTYAQVEEEKLTKSLNDTSAALDDQNSGMREYEQTVDESNQRLADLEQQMKLNEASYKNTGDAIEYYETQSELLNDALDTNAQKQEALSSEIEIAKGLYGENSEEVSNLERSLTQAQIEEEQLKSKVADANQALNDSGNAAQGSGSAIDELAQVVAAAGIADMIKEIGEAAFEMASQFDEASSIVVEGTGATGDALEQLNDSAHKAFGEIADADATLSSTSDILAELNTRFGSTGDELTDLTVDVSNFAHHTGTDGVQAVDSIANVINRWGLELSDTGWLLDDLTTANQSCQMSVSEMTGYLQKNSAQFQELGFSVDDALAMLISLSDGGANVGTVVNGLTKTISNLSGVTNDVPGAFQQAITAIKNTDSVSAALNAQVGNTGKTVEEVFGKKVAQEMITAVQNGNFELEKWSQVLATNEGALQSTTEAATTMDDKWAQAQNNLSLALNQTFAPAISAVVGVVSDLVSWGAQVMQDCPIIQGLVVAVAAALGVLAVALGISATIQAVTSAFALLNTTMLFNPITLVVAAIAALIAIFVTLWNNCEEFRNFWIGLWNGIVSFFQPVIDVINAGIQWLCDNLGFLQPIIEGIGGAFSWFADTVGNAWNFITGSTEQGAAQTAASVQTNGDAMNQSYTAALDGMVDTTGTDWMNIQSTTNSAQSNIQSSTDSFMSGMGGSFSSGYSNAVNTATSAYDQLGNVSSQKYNEIANNTANTMGSIGNTVSSEAHNMANDYSSSMSSMSSTANSELSSIGSSVSSGMSSASSEVSHALNDMRSQMESGCNAITNIWNNMRFSTPHIAVPHFHVSGQLDATAKPPTVPSVSVDWYAKGAILTNPTLFGMMGGNLLGGGEAGNEAVLPIELLKGYMNETIQNNLASFEFQNFVKPLDSMNSHLSNIELLNHQLDADIRSLERTVTKLNDRVTVLEVDGQAIAQTTAGNFDYVNGNRQNLAARGLSL